MSKNQLEFVEINPSGKHQATVIWLHGLGDSGHGFAPIVPEFQLPSDHGIRFVFPHAPERPVTINGGMRMRAWYDIKTMDFNHRADVPGVEESAQLVLQLFENELNKGISSEKVILAGFSQGGVIALHLAARLQHKLAAVLAMSTYLSEPESVQSSAVEINKTTPIMMAHGEHDEVVPVYMGQAAHKTLKDNGFNVSWKAYPMQHNVCIEELKDIREFLLTNLTNTPIERQK